MVNSRRTTTRRNGADDAATNDAHTASASSSAAAASTSPPSLTLVDSHLSHLLSQPSHFYAASPSNAASCISATKVLYDISKTTAPNFLSITESVPKLVTHANLGTAVKSSSSSSPTTSLPFTTDQIYAQLSLHSTPLLQRMNEQIRVLEANLAHAIQQGDEDGEEDTDAEQQAMEDEEMEDEADGEEDEEGKYREEEEDDEDADLDEEQADGDEEGENSGEDEEEKEEEEGGGEDETDEFRGARGVTEDAFFSLDDMEKFADMYEGTDDEGEIDGEDDDGEKMEGDEEQQEDEEEEDDALDIAALRRKAIRAKHESTLAPARALKDEELDLDEDVGEIDADNAERYKDFFDPPPAELLKSKKRGSKKAKSMEDHYADEDKQDYVDDDMLDEFGGAFRELSTSAREGTLDKARVSGRKAEKEEKSKAAAAAASAVPENESTYERQQRRLQEQISQIESKIVKPREWAQLGEVSGKARPVDSLLTTNLEFEHAGKIAPTITQEYTEELEALIKRRIIKEEWNDVVRKYEEDLVPKKKKANGLPELNEEKSSVGLAEVYEQEFLAEKQKSEGRPTVSEEKVQAQHEVIGKLVGELFHKLDSLCNFHFTPRSIHASELEVSARPNVSAIQMEEVLPVHMSEAQTVAPQDVYDVSQAVMVGETEKTSEEKHSRHRRTKAQRKKAFDAAQTKEKEKMQGMSTQAREGNAEQGILRKAISSKEMKAATTARNVIQAGGKSAFGGKATKGGKSVEIAHGQNTKFSNSSAFFGKMQSNNIESAHAKKKQKLG